MGELKTGLISLPAGYVIHANQLHFFFKTLLSSNTSLVIVL